MADAGTRHRSVTQRLPADILDGQRRRALVVKLEAAARGRLGTPGMTQESTQTAEAREPHRRRSQCGAGGAVSSHATPKHLA